MKASARGARGPSSAFETRRRLLVVGGGAALILVALIAGFTAATSDRILRRQAEYRSLGLAYHIASVTTQYVAERQRETAALAANPALIRAAREAERAAVQRGLDRQSIPDLEQAFASRRMLGGDAELEAYLRRYPMRSDMAELFFTERHGFTVLASERTSDFVQSDEEWWRMAMRDGVYLPEASFDSSASVVSLEIDMAIRALPTDEPAGVLKAVFRLGSLSDRLEAGDLSGGTYLQVVDRGGRLLVAPGGRQLLSPLPQGAAIERTVEATVQVVPTGGGDELVVAMPANGGAWWVVLRQPVEQAFVAATTTRRAVWFAAGALLLLTIGAVAISAVWLHRAVTKPVGALALLAGRVSRGDLTAEMGQVETPSTEATELATALGTMVTELRRLVGGMQITAADAAAMAQEISAATEEMSASTEEVASTTADLTERATRQAAMVRRAAEDAAKIQGIIEELAVGATEAAERNASLALLARSHRDELDRSTAELVRLTEEIGRGAEEAEALASSSNEIEQFVTQTKAIAKQTHMLALNAAIEAARGGGEGRGFTVVAEEVRKLAAQASRAAGSTSETVQSVLTRVHAARERLLRLAQGGQAARDAAHSAADGLRVVAEEAETNDQWTRAISESAGEVRVLVEGIADRMKAVAASTEEYAAAAQQIAAASQELNASTEEIASSAGHLANSAESLSGAVGGFRLPPTAGP